MRSMLFVPLVHRSYKCFSLGEFLRKYSYCFGFFMGFKSSVQITGPCLQIKVPHVKQNCNFLDITLIFVHIFTKHSSLREGYY